MALNAGENYVISTDLTKLLGIKHPIILAGMFGVSGSKVAAAVSNAGGLGVIGGLTFTPRVLELSIKHLTNDLVDKSLPFGVDFAFPKIGDGARKTNYDYSKGKIDQLIDVIINANKTKQANCKLLVSAIGIPPKHIIDKLHQNNILVMNMIGHPKHVTKALDCGVDIVCAQGTEGGGHTGSIATTVLLPKVVDICREYSKTHNRNVYAVGSGGIYDGRGLSCVLNYGCEAAWIGTRFVASKEADAPLAHKNAIINAGFDDTYRSLVLSGRPLRLIKSDYVTDWKTNRQNEMKKLLDEGIIPIKSDFGDSNKIKKYMERTDLVNKYDPKDLGLYLSGQVAANINKIQSCKEIIDEMMMQACQIMKFQASRISIEKSKL